MEFRSLDELAASATDKRSVEYTFADDATLRSAKEVAAVVLNDRGGLILTNPEVVFCKSDLCDTVGGYLDRFTEWERRVKLQIGVLKKMVPIIRSRAGLDGERTNPVKGAPVLECIPTEKLFSIHLERRGKRTSDGALGGPKKRPKTSSPSSGKSPCKAPASSKSPTAKKESPCKAPASSKSPTAKKDLDSRGILFESDSDEDDEQAKMLKRLHQDAFYLFNLEFVQTKLKVLQHLEGAISRANRKMRQEFLLSNTFIGSGTTDLEFFDV